MSQSIPAPVQQEAEQVIEGVILKSPKVRSVVAATAGVVGVGLTATTTAYGSLIAAHVVAGIPVWLGAAYAVYGILAPVAFGIWKANVK